MIHKYVYSNFKICESLLISLKNNKEVEMILITFFVFSEKTVRHLFTQIVLKHLDMESVRISVEKKLCQKVKQHWKTTPMNNLTLFIRTGINYKYKPKSVKPKTLLRI